MIRNSIEHILMSEGFEGVGVVILSIAISVFAKNASRSHQYSGNRRSWNEFAVGIDLAVSAIILLITKSIERFSQLHNIQSDGEGILKVSKEFALGMWCVLFLTMMMWAVSEFIRRWGWDSKNNLNRWSGVVIPNILGALFLFFVVQWF